MGLPLPPEWTVAHGKDKLRVLPDTPGTPVCNKLHTLLCRHHHLQQLLFQFFHLPLSPWRSAIVTCHQSKWKGAGKMDYVYIVERQDTSHSPARQIRSWLSLIIFGLKSSSGSTAPTCFVTLALSTPCQSSSSIFLAIIQERRPGHGCLSCLCTAEDTHGSSSQLSLPSPCSQAPQVCSQKPMDFVSGLPGTPPSTQWLTDCLKLSNKPCPAIPYCVSERNTCYKNNCGTFSESSFIFLRARKRGEYPVAVTLATATEYWTLPAWSEGYKPALKVTF